MSLEKAIEHGKERRKPYYRSGRYDPSCRPGGDCPWCLGNRMHSKRVKELTCEEQEKETKYGVEDFEQECEGQGDEEGEDVLYVWGEDSCGS